MGLLDETDGDLVTHWKTVAAITDQVGEGDAARIWPHKPKVPEALPYLIYTGAGGMSHQHLEGMSGNGETVVQATAFATLPSTALAIITGVKLLERLQKAAMGDTWVDFVTVSRPMTGHDAPKPGEGMPARHWARVTINIHHAEEPT